MSPAQTNTGKRYLRRQSLDAKIPRGGIGFTFWLIRFSFMGDERGKKSHCESALEIDNLQMM